jgi:putative ABC transport system substrate-binding protein
MQGNNVAVLISREITPYIHMVEGLEANLRGLEVQRFFLDERGRPYSLVASGLGLEPEAYSAIVAVGPEALRYLQPRTGAIPLLYAMVLNPENIIDPTYPQPCGVSLNIPVAVHLHAIKQLMPQLHSLGVLFDPANNADWFRHAQVSAAALDIELVSLQVTQVGARISIVGDFNHLDALLFIPDKSIISKVVIQHVIKQAAARGVPVIGYNSFFYASGAAAVFSVDYTRVGEQTATLVNHALTNGTCTAQLPPEFNTRTNEIVHNSLKQYRSPKREP